MTRIKCADLCGKKPDELQKQLNDLRQELNVLRVGKVTGSGGAAKLSKIRRLNMASQDFNVEVIKEGSGDKSKNGQKVSVHYTGRLTNGTKFDSSSDRGKPSEFKLGEGKVIKGWDQGVAQMSKGEQAKITCPPGCGK
ncbi:unnamed protein product [Didymodactylos carnosus]|uniref:peptidylprolyl isomerase n=1 Tax=Didymodactylos carnosus TaxID=1234261 RepID=A0A814XW88_9BILA|nr:unnamed protein product [Didymodactylos carnosus]CAF3984520.1 unnamed protein product [Didymodactylos carnosus]